MTADVEQAKDRLGVVPFLAERGLGALNGVTGQLPVAVQPVRVADHGDDAILAVARGQIARRLVGKVARGHAHVELAAFHFLFRSGVAGSGGLGTGSDRLLALAVAGGGQGIHQLLLAHRMPAREALVTGQRH